MSANRIKNWSSPLPTTKSEQLPAATYPQQVPPGFAVCPQQLSMAQGWQQAIYRLAYERALEQTRLPRHHRSLFCVWN